MHFITGKQMERRRQTGAVEPRLLAFDIDHRHCELAVHPDVIIGADVVEE